MIWVNELEQAIRFDKQLEPKRLELHISETLDKIEATARKLAFAVHDIGFVRARAVFERYWTGMSSEIQEDTEVGGYITSLTIEREMSYAFKYTIKLITTENGIMVNKKYRYTFTDTRENEARLFAFSHLELEKFNNPVFLKEFVDRIMFDFVHCYREFLTTDIGRI